MSYYDEIKNKLIDNEIYSVVKDYSKERYKVITYFEIGKLLNEAGGKYGDNIINEYSKKLVIEVGKKYNKRTLFRMKQFYNVFSDKKVSTLSTQLSWSHYTELLSIKNKNELLYYLNICINKTIDVRKLRSKIKNKEYDRLSEDTKFKLMNKENIHMKDLVPNIVLIKNSKNLEILSERILQQLILENIEDFMNELGSFFSFVGKEYKIKINDRYNYIDLLLFNIEYNCFVVVELKITELKKDHIGQIQIYMNYIDKNIKKINQDKTIGIIICKQDNKYIIEYCSDERIMTKEYQLI